MTKRAHVSLRVKLASALAELQYLRGDPIPWEQLKAMTAEHLLSLYTWDHGALHYFTANNHFTNLTPRLILAHREKSKKDAAIVAKSKRITKKPLTRAMEKMVAVDVRGAKADGPRRQPMAGSKASPWKRKMSGKVERRPC